VKPRGLLKGGGYGLGRWGRFGDCVVDFFPDEGIVIAGNDRPEEGFDAVEVEVVGVDGGVESR